MKNLLFDQVLSSRPLFLAPMAGVTDAAFRILCAECGADGTVSEMVSAKALTLGDKTSLCIAARAGTPGLYGVQLFASDPLVAGEAVKILSQSGVDCGFFDLNCGCPAPKIVNNGCGSALMKTPALIGDIVSRMAKNSPVPVTVKMRAGYDSDRVTAVEAALAAESCGAAAIFIHGRTRDRMYAPPVDLSVIAAVKNAVNVPVIGNGDVFTAFDAKNMLKETGCDGLMIGRGALGRPYFFTAVKHYLDTNEILCEPSPKEKCEYMLRHIRMLAQSEGEKSAMMKARKHAAWYTKGIKNSAAFRREMNLSVEELAKRISKEENSGGWSAPSVGNFA